MLGCIYSHAVWPFCSRDVLSVYLSFTCGSAGKESAFNEGDLGSIPGLGRSPAEGKAYSLPYSSLENSIYYIDHGVAKSQTRLSDFHLAVQWGIDSNASMHGVSMGVTCCHCFYWFFSGTLNQDEMNVPILQMENQKLNVTLYLAHGHSNDKWWRQVSTSTPHLLSPHSVFIKYWLKK